MPIHFPERDHSRDCGYTHGALDRISDRRGDEALIAELLARDDARFMVFAGDRVLTTPAEPHEPRLTRQAATALSASFAAPVLLGLDSQTRQPVFACETMLPSETFTPEALETRSDLAISDLRSLALAGEMEPSRIGELAQASAVLTWHRTHRFCSRCGQPSAMAMAGWQRNCTACGTPHFPRTDPVVIMLVVDGERCLLGRQTRFPPGMYSTLAGFVESGETLEDAVRREVFEEAGIRCGRVTYFASQPWPFPMNLMIGMIAEAVTTDIHVDEKELEDCRWFTRDEVHAMFAETHPAGFTAPKPLAIAHHLLKAFLA